MLVPENHILFRLKKRKKLAKILRTEPSNFKNIETSFEVRPFNKNDNGKIRLLYNTDKNYKALLRRLNRLYQSLNIPDYVYGGVPNRDFLDNAYAHHMRPYVQTVDIKNFFPSTRDSYVYGFYKHKLQVSPDVAKILTLLTTCPIKGTVQRHIPQGFPTSTLLSFLAYFDLFNGIYELCKKENIHFSLFVDDMTFSSHEKIPKSFLRHIEFIVKKYNLCLNPNKIKRYDKYTPKNVTGIIIDSETYAFKAPNKLQKEIYNNFMLLKNIKVTTFKSYIELKKIVLTLDGQVKALQRIESNREFPYIRKVLEDIKGCFNTPFIKGASYQQLFEEYLVYISEENNKTKLN